MRGIVAGAISALVMAAVPVAAAAPQSEQVRGDVQAVLGKSAAGWNSANLDLFMSCYEDAPTTSYVSGDKVTQGFQAIRSVYGTRFAGGTKAMGQLSLEVVDLRMVGNANAYVIGRFTLRRDGGDVSGITTLLFRKTAAGWRIVADHS
ncbi:MAG TPA: hypothetical protein VF503_07455 [Sphingobium sp.]|uniref:YybH family protein n=1 Tax=Sphingobium sp. TaxID=1912891 RepID=UPI002ED369CF